jgi:NAD(P)-dependent dehydrogenase (short-subunit alcohol dehydrogenase family)
MLDVDLVAPFLLSQQVVVQSPTPPERMSIINIASIHGVVASGRVSSASYTASKAGIINMTRELAVQWARKGVRVNAIAPGWFQTEATAEMFGNEKPATWLRRQTPMGRTGEIHELDGALRFLASDASSFMTGQVIVVDGGWTSV